MNLKIKQLMSVPAEKHDVSWLQQALQSALELELSTLPPYLCGYWCLEDSSSVPAQLIISIAMDEMSHFGLACNMLRATGIQPLIFTGYDSIVYPGPLPGGVRPKCDPSFFPCQEDFQVVLGFNSFSDFASMAMQIEYPEDPVPRPPLTAAADTYPTIGQFYDAVLKAFQQNDGKFTYQTALQLTNGSPDVFVVDGLANATKAITIIQTEGEGSRRYPFVDAAGTTLSHFYKFGEIFYGKAYVYDAATKTGNWTGSPITLPAVYPMTPVPLGGYPAPPAEVSACDKAFTQMLTDLDTAWAQGSASALSDAITDMSDLATAATSLLGKQIACPGGGIYGPQFRKLAQ
jgi:hypothetical protein